MPDALERSPSTRRQAISPADDRLLITFSVLGERWGRMNHEGIVITLPLTHETLAMMIGVRRPTATIAVKRLTDAGLLERRGPRLRLLTKRAVDRLMQPDGFQHRADGAVCPTAYLTGVSCTQTMSTTTAESASRRSCGLRPHSRVFDSEPHPGCPGR